MGVVPMLVTKNEHSNRQLHMGVLQGYPHAHKQGQMVSEAVLEHTYMVVNKQKGL